MMNPPNPRLRWPNMLPYPAQPYFYMDPAWTQLGYQQTIYRFPPTFRSNFLPPAHPPHPPAPLDPTQFQVMHAPARRFMPQQHFYRPVHQFQVMPPVRHPFEQSVYRGPPARHPFDQSVYRGLPPAKSVDYHLERNSTPAQSGKLHTSATQDNTRESELEFTSINNDKSYSHVNYDPTVLPENLHGAWIQVGTPPPIRRKCEANNSEQITPSKAGNYDATIVRVLSPSTVYKMRRPRAASRVEAPETGAQSVGENPDIENSIRMDESSLWGESSNMAESYIPSGCEEISFRELSSDLVYTIRRPRPNFDRHGACILENAESSILTSTSMTSISNGDTNNWNAQFVGVEDWNDVMVADTEVDDDRKIDEKTTSVTTRQKAASFSRKPKVVPAKPPRNSKIPPSPAAAADATCVECGPPGTAPGACGRSVYERQLEVSFPTVTLSELNITVSGGDAHALSDAACCAAYGGGAISEPVTAFGGPWLLSSVCNDALRRTPLAISSQTATNHQLWNTQLSPLRDTTKSRGAFRKPPPTDHHQGRSVDRNAWRRRSRSLPRNEHATAAPVTSRHNSHGMEPEAADEPRKRADFKRSRSTSKKAIPVVEERGRDEQLTYNDLKKDANPKTFAKLKGILCNKTKEPQSRLCGLKTAVVRSGLVAIAPAEVRNQK